MERSWFLDDEHYLATRLAHIFLKKYRKLIGSKTIGNMYPLYEPGSDTPAFYEVNLLDKKGKPDGYIILSLAETHPPVIEFSLEGKSRYLQLAQTVRSDQFRPVFFPPFYFIAENQAGDYLGHLDPLPVFPSKRGTQNRKFNYQQMKEDYARSIKKSYKKNAPEINKTWNSIRKEEKLDLPDLSIRAVKNAKGDFDHYIDPEDIPERDYQRVSISYPEYLPEYNQIPPMMGANNLPWNSGCGSVAWMVVIGYHNNTHTLDLLRGTSYSNRVNDKYIPQVLMALSTYMGTFPANGDGGGINDDDHLKAYQFIESELGFPVPYKINTFSGGVSALQVIYDAICFQGSPSVTSVPGHALAAYEVLLDLSENSNDHFVRVYNREQEQVVRPYVAYQYLRNAFAVGKIPSRHDFDTDIRSICTPAAAELGDPFSTTKLVLATRNENENICLYYSNDGKNFDLKYEIPATGNTSPSIAVKRLDDNLYAAWKEADGTLRLVAANLKHSEVTHLPAPDGTIQQPNVGPAIERVKGFLFFVWESNIAFTSTQNLERSSYHWPSEVGYSVPDSHYLGSLGFAISAETPCLEIAPNTNPDKEKLFYTYTSSVGTRMLMFSLAEDPDTGAIELVINNDTSGNSTFPGSSRLLFVPDYFTSSSDLTTIYGTEYGPIAEFLKDPWNEATYSLTKEYKYHPLGISTSDVNLGMFSSYEIGPCVFTVYLDGSRVRIRYHSIDNEYNSLDYEGYPDF